MYCLRLDEEIRRGHGMNGHVGSWPSATASTIRTPPSWTAGSSASARTSDSDERQREPWMTWQRRLRLAVVPVLLAVPFLLTPGVAGATPAGDSCYGQTAQLTVEEQRLTVGFTSGGPAVGPE